MIKTLLKVFLIIFLSVSGINGAYADFSFNDMQLKFVQLSDTHITDEPDTQYKALSSSKDLLTSAIKDINSIKGLDFVVFTGDMVNLPTKQYYFDFINIASKLNYPSIFVLGNHDSLTGNEYYFDKAKAYDVIRKSNPYQSKYGKPYFAFSPNTNYRVIVLDTTLGYQTAPNGHVDAEQLAFLDNEINNNQDKVVLIFHHHPIVEPFKSEDHKMDNASEYFSILDKYKKTPIIIFSGHYHAAKITRKDNVVHVSSPALVTYPNAFRYVKITDFDDRVVLNLTFMETKLKHVQLKSKLGLLASSAFSGMPSDKNQEIVIKKGYVPKNTPSKESAK